MIQAIAAIQNEHRNMTRLLDLLEQQIDLFEQGTRPDYDLIKEIIDYFLTFPDLYHHPKEDLIFRKLQLRDPEGAKKFGNLEAEHEKVSDRLHAFTRAVVNVLLDGAISREAVVEVARTFINGERKHMKAEEGIFFPAAEKTLTDKDWREIDALIENFTDPLDKSETSSRFSLVNAKIAEWQGVPA